MTTKDWRAEAYKIGDGYVSEVAASHLAFAAAVLEELREWAENLRHSDDAKINWDHPGNDQRERFYKNMVAHSWIQAGQAMVREIDRRLAQLKGST